MLLVDDHPLVRRGLADVIAREPDLEVCGEAGDVPEAMREVERTHPDVVVIDLSLKTGHGHRADREAQEPRSAIKTLVSSMHDETLFAERVLRAGAMGYITKQEPPEALVPAIRQVLRGEFYLSPRMTSRLLHRVVGGGAVAGGPGARPLQPRDRGVRDDRPGPDDPADRRPFAPQPENHGNPPREDQAEAQSQEQHGTEPPRGPVGAGTRVVRPQHRRRRQLADRHASRFH